MYFFKLLFSVAYKDNEGYVTHTQKIQEIIKKFAFYTSSSLCQHVPVILCSFATF